MKYGPMRNLVGRMIASSIVNLFKNQPDVLAHTSQTTMTEWNLAHHLANEIAKYIFWLNHDLDVTKKEEGKRPDIIFHKRRINALNFLVIELKREYDNIENDIRRVKRIWMGGRLEYRFGASVVIVSEKDWEIHLFERDRDDDKEPITSSNFKDHLCPITQPDQLILIVSQIKDLVDKITNAEKQGKNANIEEWQREIDELVYKLYGIT